MLQVIVIHVVIESEIRKFTQIQNLTDGCEHGEGVQHCKTVLKALRWLRLAISPIHQVQKYTVFTLVFRGAHGLTPAYLCLHIHPAVVLRQSLVQKRG